MSLTAFSRVLTDGRVVLKTGKDGTSTLDPAPLAGATFKSVKHLKSWYGDDNQRAENCTTNGAFDGVLVRHFGRDRARVMCAQSGLKENWELKDKTLTGKKIKKVFRQIPHYQLSISCTNEASARSFLADEQAKALAFAGFIAQMGLADGQIVALEEAFYDKVIEAGEFGRKPMFEEQMPEVAHATLAQLIENTQQSLAPMQFVLRHLVPMDLLGVIGRFLFRVLIRG